MAEKIAQPCRVSAFLDVYVELDLCQTIKIPKFKNMELPKEVPKEKRRPNFSAQECLLLAQIMGDIHPDFIVDGLNFHAVDKHRFTGKITSETKKKGWKLIGDKFNAAATFTREHFSLQKKWENLVSIHRNLFSDYQRAITLTGRGPSRDGKLCELTDTIMSVVGKSSVSVVGACTDVFDSTMESFMAQQQDQPEHIIFEIADTVAQFEPPSTSTSTSTIPLSHDCCCDAELRALKKRKLCLQIELLERKLKEQK